MTVLAEKESRAEVTIFQAWLQFISKKKKREARAFNNSPESQL